MTLVLRLALSLAAAIGGYALVSWNQRQIARRCADAHVRPKPLVRCSDAVRACAFGGLTACGLLLEAYAHEWIAIVPLIVAIAITFYQRVPIALSHRTDGAWLPLRETDAFESIAMKEFIKQAAPIALASIVIALMATILFDTSARAFSFAIANQAIFVPIAFTATRRQCSSTLWGAARHRLASVYASLRSHPAVQTIPIAYVVSELGVPNELRIALRPRNACDGFVSIEIGLACVRDRLGVAFVPDAIVRVHEESDASRAMRTFSPASRPVRGRDPSEQVYPLSLAALGGRAIDKRIAHLCSQFAVSPTAEHACAEMPDTRGALDRWLRTVAGEIRRWSGYKMALQSSGTSHARFSSANSP